MWESAGSFWHGKLCPGYLIEGMVQGDGIGKILSPDRDEL